MRSAARFTFVLTVALATCTALAVTAGQFVVAPMESAIMPVGDPLGDPSGACCFWDGSCELLPQYECWSYRGTWLGPDTTCADCDAPPGHVIVRASAS